VCLGTLLFTDPLCNTVQKMWQVKSGMKVQKCMSVMKYLYDLLQRRRATSAGLSDTTVQAVSSAGLSICLLVQWVEVEAHIFHTEL